MCQINEFCTCRFVDIDMVTSSYSSEELNYSGGDDDDDDYDDNFVL